MTIKIQELGHIVLYVSNVERLSNFYKNILGFHEIFHDSGVAVFSGGRTHHELMLLEVGTESKKRGMEPGLYHIGFKVGDSPESLKAVYKELKSLNVSIIGSSDHGVTHSVYILDPDGNELELYADVSDIWKSNPQAVMSPTKSLNLD